MARLGGHTQNRHNTSKVAHAVKSAAKPEGPPGIIPGQPAAGHHPFDSRAQWRLFFANPKLRKWAIGKAHATGGHREITKRLHFSPAYRGLPERERGLHKGQGQGKHKR
jgi:hypothetical protein